MAKLNIVLKLITAELIQLFNLLSKIIRYYHINNVL